uniref:Uncharacterized protein n=1 Tax=Glossina austeni TaxID=7395 RepID=A0A1A9UV19_GLOAU
MKTRQTLIKLSNFSLSDECNCVIHTSIRKCVKLYDDFIWLNIAVTLRQLSSKISFCPFLSMRIFTTLRKILRPVLETIDIEKIGFFHCDGVKCRIPDVALDYLWKKVDDSNHHLKTCDLTPMDFSFQNYI